MTHSLRTLVRALAAIALVMGTMAWAPTFAQTAAAQQYEKTLAREQDARATPDATPASLRAIAKAYETIVRQHPTSGYADNALWQGAGLLQLAFERAGQLRDRNDAARLLNWLKKEYPTSSFAKQVDGRLAAIGAPQVAVNSVATTPAADAASSPSAPGSSAPPREAAAVVRAIAHTALPKGDRVTIELSRELPYTASRADNPDRIVFDVANLAMPAAADQSPVTSALVKGLAISKTASGGTRFTLELKGRPRFSSFPLYSPFRLVIDIESDAPSAATSVTGDATPAPATPSTTLAVARPSRESAAPAMAPTPASPAVTRKGDYSLARQLGLSVSRIVIDPGHGGYDPGASANGVTEADLVLDVALRVERLLRDQSGFEIVLTRRTNEFIPLEQRTAIANREDADLFLSIHANASSQLTARGVETFFLNFGANPQAEALAARENATSSRSMRILPELVKAITLNNKLAESRELADVVQSSLMRRMTPQSKGLKDLGVKQAPFVVLIGAQMPSVLAEISFLTNRTDASLLKQPAYRQRIAQALCDAIVRYRASLKKVATVAAKTSER